LSTRPITLFVNTGNTLIQAANYEEGVAGQRTWDPISQDLERV